MEEMNRVTVIGVTRVTPALTPMAANMTLRDWYAGMALQGLIAGFGGRTGNAPAASELAEWANDVADAMMAEREKK
jgi:hypothetical protein